MKFLMKWSIEEIASGNTKWKLEIIVILFFDLQLQDAFKEMDLSW